MKSGKTFQVCPGARQFKHCRSAETIADSDGIIDPAGFAGDSALVKLTAVYPVGASLPVAGDFDVVPTEIAGLNGDLMAEEGVSLNLVTY